MINYYGKKRKTFGIFSYLKKYMAYHRFGESPSEMFDKKNATWMDIKEINIIFGRRSECEKLKKNQT